VDLREFVHRHGTDLPSVVRAVKEKIGLSEGDALIAVGSLVEGLGNVKSDVDLILIPRRPDRTLRARSHETLVVGRCLIDVRILHLTECDALFHRFERWSRLSWEVTHAVKFTIDERTLLHRLVKPHVLFGAQSAPVLGRLPKRTDLARLKLHVARQMSRTIQVDMVGYRQIRDYRSLVFAAQEVLGHAIDGLTAGHHLTNPLIKWRSRLLDALPSHWETLLGTRPTGLTAGEQFWRLHRAPSVHTRSSALKHALAITTFARGVYLWAEQRLLDSNSVGSPTMRLPHRTLRFAGVPLPYLDLDVDLVVHEGRAAIARLNEFDEPLPISRREAELILLFDGVTTAREAARIACPSRRPQTASRIVNRLLSRVAAANLSLGSL
jgi:hypothetical protein